MDGLEFCGGVGATVMLGLIMYGMWAHQQDRNAERCAEATLTVVAVDICGADNACVLSATDHADSIRAKADMRKYCREVPANRNHSEARPAPSSGDGVHS